MLKRCRIAVWIGWMVWMGSGQGWCTSLERDFLLLGEFQMSNDGKYTTSQGGDYDGAIYPYSVPLIDFIWPHCKSAPSNN